MGQMDYLEYKKYHEAQMSNNTGSSVFEIEAVLTTITLGIFIRLWLNFYTIRFHNFFIDFLSIALPVTLEVTVMSGYSYIIPINMFLIFITVTLKNIYTSHVRETLLKKVSNNRKSYISNFRAGTNLVSALCILAVDFSVFPRRYAKTETFGFSLMDIGVGYFICSNGIVTKNAIYSSEFLKMVKSTSVLILLGIIRLASVKTIDYHEHASEYGVHWNFFFTLGFCRVISYLILMISPIKKPLLLAVFIGVFHECLLHFGLQGWVMSDVPRDSFLSANREGLTSLLGYVSLFFASVAAGQVINKDQITYQKLLVYLSGLCLSMWTGTGICCLTIGISRRLANAGYTFWVIASLLTIMLELVLIDIVISSFSKRDKGKLENLSQTSMLMDSINSNGLFFFLFANLLTGLINILFQTLLLGPFSSLALITLYMVVLCCVPYILYSKKWILKFW